MFYYALTFLPVGFIISIFSKKEKPVIDAFMVSVLVSLIIVLIIHFGLIKLNINIFDLFIFNVVGSAVGSYIYTLFKYISKKINMKKIKE